MIQALSALVRSQLWTRSTGFIFAFIIFVLFTWITVRTLAGNDQNSESVAHTHTKTNENRQQQQEQPTTTTAAVR